MCIDAGANLFVSHGAPVLQAVEIYNGAPIFYGLGNFLFHVHPAPRFPLRRWVPVWPLLIRETVPPRRSRPAGGLWLPGFRPHHSGTRRRTKHVIERPKWGRNRPVAIGASSADSCHSADDL
ncbi:CapA family protein [Mesorhizobium sp. M0802]|uniref:CapA family protein n=1 Tax=Mesorhizobium sp. M0802 TaxID=2957001 RepID=UPI00333832A8